MGKHWFFSVTTLTGIIRLFPSLFLLPFAQALSPQQELTGWHYYLWLHFLGSNWRYIGPGGWRPPSPASQSCSAAPAGMGGRWSTCRPAWACLSCGWRWTGSRCQRSAPCTLPVGRLLNSPPRPKTWTWMSSSCPVGCWCCRCGGRPWAALW